MAAHGKSERNIQNYFVVGQFVIFQDQQYEIRKVGKPTCSEGHGEPKTDVYILLKNTDKEIELKISYKKSNADFLENKIKAERAEQILGKDWSLIIERATRQLTKEFERKPLIYLSQRGRTQKGSITLGWRFEFMNKKSGELSEKLPLTLEQYLDIYSGNNLSDEKRNAKVCGEIIVNSGVANYFLQGNEFSSAQDVLAHIEPMDEYITNCPEIYFSCKALNYRTFSRKIEGNRDLAVLVDWNIDNGKLTPKLVFSQPLQCKGRTAKDKLVENLEQLGIQTTDDINANNTDINCIYE